MKRRHQGRGREHPPAPDGECPTGLHWPIAGRNTTTSARPSSDAPHIAEGPTHAYEHTHGLLHRTAASRTRSTARDRPDYISEHHQVAGKRLWRVGSQEARDYRVRLPASIRETCQTPPRLLRLPHRSGTRQRTCPDCPVFRILAMECRERHQALLAWRSRRRERRGKELARELRSKVCP